MIIVSFASKILTSILVGYLTLTSSLADFLVSITPNEEIQTIATSDIGDETDSAEQSARETATSLAITEGYEFGGAIPKILLENSEFQEAATQASLLKEQARAEFNNLPLEEQVLKSLVNIFCQYRTDEYIRTTTGTGFFIHQNGVVLTNAHVAQFLLLEESGELIRETSCVLRSGNPATAMYHAELLYISPAWISANASLVDDQAPVGTGERDYALLYVSKAVDGVTLPLVFPALPLHTELLSQDTAGTEVIAAGYPADILFEEGADALLLPVLASTSVGELYTFRSNYADIFSITDSSVGEQGASGGPVVKLDGKAMGLIVTKGNTDAEGERSLRALTLSYLDRTITEETGFSLLQNMQGDLAFKGKIFKRALAPFLSRLLSFELD